METRFLSENELPASAQAKNNEATNTGEADIMQDDKFDENVRKLMEITTQDFEVCKNTLVQSGGNYDLALNNLLGQI